MPTLTLAGITFSGDSSPATGFHFNGLDDWFSLSNSKSEVHERPQADGAFGIDDEHRESLVLSFKGWYLAQTRLEMIQAKRQLLGAFGARGKKVAALTDVDGTTTRVVSIRSAPIPDNRGSLAFSFTVDMVATDPLAYGDVGLVVADVPVAGGGLIFPLGSGASYIDFLPGGSTGRISVTNTGTAPVYPTFDVSGGLADGFVVTDVTANRSIRFDRQVPLGSVVTVVQRTGRASIDGPTNDVSGFLTSRQFWAIGPGETHDIQFQPLGAVVGTPRLTVRQTPAWY